ncbi:MAG TPA: hypothetical protein VG759_24120 [Candidatus Angelobacter sp.]|jgi:hypothetical protein|nr:hypothetical protein [Candidatus Angelobacter sp.]
MKTMHRLLLISLVCFSTTYLNAFCPKNGDIKCLKGAVGLTHEDITTIAFKVLAKEFFGKDKLSPSMQKALEKIVDSNALVDENQHLASLHVDGESFDEAQTRLSNAKTALEKALSKDDAEVARTVLGIALHTIQDFYSHSNWIELGNTAPNPFLGRGTPLSFAGPTDKTCINCLPSISVCLDCSFNLITGQLTSGYYSGEDHKKPFLGLLSGKCSHGGITDNSTFIPPNGGINKDTLLCIASPHTDLHLAAATVAALASEQFIRDIKQDITDKQLRELFGVGPTLAFAIDDTGSMGDIIGQVQSQVAQAVDARVGTPDEPSNYILVPINDPVDGPTAQFDNPDDFKSALFSLFASGGGDCPELQNGGMLMAVDASEKGGDVFMFTDASSKDGGLAGAVAGLAATKNVQVYPMAFGDCSFFGAPTSLAPGSLTQSVPTSAAAVLAGAPTFNVDPSYQEIADVSGGQVFALQRFEAGAVARLANAVVHDDAAQLLSIGDTLSGTAKSFSVPVDSSVTQITFSVSGTNAATIFRPNGNPVLSTDPDLNLIALSNGIISTIATPAVGIWTITVNGSGTFSMNVSGVSPFSLRSAHFVEVRGRSGHQGLYNIPGFPVLAVDNNLRVDLSDTPATVNFDLRTKAGSVIQSFAATADTNLPTVFFGTVAIPTSPFLTYITGTNSAGEQYQRVLPSMFKPQTVKLVPPPGENIAPGKTIAYTFRIDNTGSQDTFTINAKDNRNFLTGLSTNSVTVPANGSGNFKAFLAVPPDTPLATQDSLTVTISGSISGGSNFATVESTVENVTALPPDCSLAQPSVTTIFPPNKKFVPVSVLGVTDPQGQNIAINIDRVLQDEPTDGPGQGQGCPAASGINSSTAQLLADRSGTGNGRVYHVLFTATNDSGLSCQGEVKVSVPHDKSSTAVDDGALFDSTSCAAK